MSAPRAARRLTAAVLAVAAAVAMSACTEKLETGAACPVLCPDQSVPVLDTVIDALALDTVISGFPLVGNTPYLLLASRGDTLETRTIFRFDRAPSRYVPTGTTGDSVAITAVDSAYLRLRLQVSGNKVTAPVTIEAFDVDTTANDTSRTVVASLFRPDRLLGSRTYAVSELTVDSLRLPLNNAAIAQRLGRNRGIRIGLRVTSAASTQLRVLSALGGSGELGARLSYDAVGDTAYRAIISAPASTTPAASPTLASGYVDYTIVTRGTSTAAGTDIVIGGVPARRAYLRFGVPSRFVDSSTVVRATLLLTQRPSGGVDQGDSITIVPDIVVANEAVFDVGRAVTVTAPGAILGIDTLRVNAGGSGVRAISVVSLVRLWATQPAGGTRAITLRSSIEGAQAGELHFYSSEAAPELRPRLRISYIPRVQFGIP